MPFDKSKFLEQFKSEARERIQALNHGLLKLEKHPGDKVLLEEMMRQSHTIKGSSAMMGYKRISNIAHRMEDGLQRALKGELDLQKDHFDMLFKCLDSIEPLLEYKLVGDEDQVDKIDVDELLKAADAAFSQSAKAVQDLKIAIAAPSEEKKPSAEPEQPKKKKAAAIEETIRVDIGKLNKLMNLSGELLISKSRLKELTKSLLIKADTTSQTRQAFGAISKELQSVSEGINLASSNIQEEVMRARMVSVSNLFGAFPRAMRDLAITKGKEIEIEIKGEETQIDKTIIDEMKDPLMHMLRNAVDHGIEDPATREKNGKSRVGKIILNSYQQGSSVIIEISDDGRGIDVNKVKEVALAKDIVSKEKVDEMADEQIFHLLFLPGFSTSDQVTETSGRGVGLDVVRDKVLALKGTVNISSDPGLGTKITMKLPLTLSITDTLIVESGSETYAIPIESVVETMRINTDDINMIEGKEAITARGHILPLVRLKDLFGVPEKGIMEKKFFPVVIVQSAEDRIGILVDQLQGHQEIVRKSLGDPLSSVRDISGATILGDGRVILILDIASIIESAQGVVIRKPKRVETAVTVKTKKHKTILLAEDALSTAMLEKNVLESAGFSVVIARDGQEALEKSSQERFDLVITDVLMPRMNGFELTGKLKKDSIYKDIPVIIVTTRETDEDKRMGLEAGADAYILKSEFTSEGLLETIERLVG